MDGSALLSNAPTASDFADAAIAAIAEASLTPGLEDDAAALSGLFGIRQGELDAARASGDPRRISAAVDAFKQVKDALEALRGTINDEAEARRRHTEALESLAAELKRQNEIAASVAGISSREALKAFADVISGQIVGRSLKGRRQTAGNGTAILIP